MCFIVFLNLFMLLFFFFSFLPTIQLFGSHNNHLIFKQDPITNVWSIFRKNDISICFVHKSQKWAIFGLTCKDKRSRDLVTIGPIFFFFFLKKRKTLKKKVSERRGAIHMRSRTIRKNRGGGAIMPPPPGLIRVKTLISLWADFLSYYWIKSWKQGWTNYLQKSIKHQHHRKGRSLLLQTVHSDS